MTDPTPNPVALDQAVLNAMKALAAARRADPPDPTGIEAARQTLIDARAARGYGDA